MRTRKAATLQRRHEAGADERGLPGPRGADNDKETCVDEARDELIHEVLTTDVERSVVSVVSGESLVWTRTSAVTDGCEQRWVLREDLPLELAQARARLHAEPFVEHRPSALVRRERIPLAPLAIQREDQQLPEVLAVGLVAHRHLGRGCRPGRVDLEQRGHQQLDSFPAQLSETGRVGRWVDGVEQVGVGRRLSPERERSPQQGDRLGPGELRRLGHRLLQPAGVDQRGIDDDAVATLAALDHERTARVGHEQCVAKPDQVALQRPFSARGSVLAPRGSHERIERDDGTCVGEERAEHAARHRAANRRRTVRAVDLERSQDTQQHPTTVGATHLARRRSR